MIDYDELLKKSEFSIDDIEPIGDLLERGVKANELNAFYTDKQLKQTISASKEASKQSRKANAIALTSLVIAIISAILALLALVQ